MTPKAFAVLRRLVEDGGQVVPKAELLRAGWAKTHVSDGVLKVIILEICRALGDDPAAPRFIETVPPIVQSLTPGEAWRWCYLDGHVV